MYNLFLCFLPLHQKDFYLTVNLADIILAVLSFFGSIAFQVIFLNYRSIIQILQVALFVTALVALIMFLSNGYYRSGWHKAYVIVRIFLTVLMLILYSLTLLSVLTNNNNYADKTRDIILISVMWLFSLISASWSYYLMKIIL